MKSGDIVTLAGGLIIVIVIALIANPHYLSGSSIAAPVTPVSTTAMGTPVVTPSPEYRVTPVPSTVPVPTTQRPDDPPYRIFYTNQPFTYPRFKLPENMGTFGASDIPMRDQELVPFAFVEDTRGGLTQLFSVPYPVWIINTTVIANRTPQYGNFRMVLCYANNGTVIEGEEILNRGSSYRIVQTSNTDVYMIITTAYIDLYHISLETPRNYYNAYRI